MSENIKQRSFPRRLKLTTKVEDQFLGVQSKEDDMTSQSKNKRVMVRVLDFDFLFQNENSNSMITVLSQANSKVLTRKSIKAFVKLMWQEYQPAIIRKVFSPYLIYLLMMILLCARSMPNFWMEMEEK